MILTLFNVKDKLKSEPLIQLSYLFGYKSHIFWQLAKSLTIQLSSGQIIVIPAGFKTDLSSSPRWLWSIAPPYGDFLLAALIHDFLYVNNIGTRKAADLEMLTWSNILNGNRLDNKVRFLAVRLFGQSWWDN